MNSATNPELYHTTLKVDSSTDSIYYNPTDVVAGRNAGPIVEFAQAFAQYFKPKWEPPSHRQRRAERTSFEVNLIWKANSGDMFSSDPLKEMRDREAEILAQVIEMTDTTVKADEINTMSRFIYTDGWTNKDVALVDEDTINTQLDYAAETFSSNQASVWCSVFRTRNCARGC
jgi:hypothetical protein